MHSCFALAYMEDSSKGVSRRRSRLSMYCCIGLSQVEDALLEERLHRIIAVMKEIWVQCRRHVEKFMSTVVCAATGLPINCSAAMGLLQTALA
jgi:hypothetical protein